MSKYTTSELISNMFLHSGLPMRIQKGEIVLGWEEEPAGIYYIEQGYIKAYSISVDGEENIQLIYGRQELFPLVWAILNIRQQVYYEALSEALLLHISLDQFTEFSQSSKLASRALMRQIAYQVYVYSERIDNLEYKKPEQRIAYRLLFLAGRFGKHTGSEIVIEGPFTHQLISDSINLARETVSREIEKMEYDNLITRRRHHIVIKDVGRLKHLLDGDLRIKYWGL